MNNQPTTAQTGKGCLMTSYLSISSIISNYQNREAWGVVCGVTLSDGTRLVATALGDGFRIYRKNMGVPLYVPFI
jgi:hypothetical protein